MSNSGSSTSLDSLPFLGGVATKPYSTLAPKRTTCHGNFQALITSSMPLARRFASGIIRSKASLVITCSSVALIAATERALPERVPPMPLSSVESAFIFAEALSATSWLTP